MGAYLKMSKLSPARKAALDVTASVRKRDAYARNLIDTQINSSSLPTYDKAFASLLVLGVVSTYGALDYIIDRNLNHPNDVKANVRDALRISVYEFVALHKEPPVVIDQGVELVRSIAPRASGLANAVLRKVGKDIQSFPWGDRTLDDRALALFYGFPQWLVKRLIHDIGRPAAERFMQASNEPSPFFVAVNAVKATDREVLKMLNDAHADATFYENGPTGCIHVGNAANAVRSQAFPKGLALVCDASAQLTASCARFIPGKTYLEVGSGRGTKTILLESFATRSYGDQTCIYALDKHAYKGEVAATRNRSYGLHGVTQVTGDALELDDLALPRTFDGAFIDAPCSGLGTLRRHPEIRWRLQPKLVSSMADIGFQMLASVAPRISRHGSIVYSTCSVLREENEEVVERFLNTPYGDRFFVQPIENRSCIQVPLVSNGPDAHFAMRLVRRD